MAADSGLSDPSSALRRWLRRARRRPGLIRRAVRKVAVQGASMYPLLSPGDVVLVDRMAFRRSSPRRGDLVLADAPRPPGGRWIKLVAALPGETVMVRQDRLWIDDRPLPFPQPLVGAPPGRWLLGPDQVFLLSYAVAIGTDSRHLGPVPLRALRGRLLAVLSPPGRRRPLERLALEPDLTFG